jgi:hypothetical protein
LSPLPGALGNINAPSAYVVDSGLNMATNETEIKLANGIEARVLPGGHMSYLVPKSIPISLENLLNNFLNIAIY